MTSGYNKSLQQENSALENQGGINDADVADYLRSHPDFFRNHPSLLGDLSLPHVSGNAVSLVEKQVAVLRERSITTRRKLGELIDNARENDSLFEKTQALIIELLQAKNSEQLFQHITTTFKRDFDVEHCAILILSATDETNTLFNPSRMRSQEQAQRIIPHIMDSDSTVCGALRKEETTFIFDDLTPQDEDTFSAAVALRPITSGMIDGSTDASPSGHQLLIAVGHNDGNHYNSSTGTLFIDYIADVVQIQLRQFAQGSQS